MDVPSLPPEMFSPFDDDTIEAAVFDCGGDPVGAAALGQLSERFALHSAETEFLYVINPMRPLQGSVAEIIDMLRLIENAARLKVTGLVCNANIALETEPQMIRDGFAMVRSVSEATAIPIRFVSAMREHMADIADVEAEKYAIELFMRPGWLDE